jgi:hypothetical protein
VSDHTHGAKYRIRQTSPFAWQLDCAIEEGWRFVARFDSEDAAKAKLAELVASHAWEAPEPQYFDATGKPENPHDNPTATAKARGRIGQETRNQRKADARRLKRLHRKQTKEVIAQ